MLPKKAKLINSVYPMSIVALLSFLWFWGIMILAMFVGFALLAPVYGENASKTDMLTLSLWNNFFLVILFFLPLAYNCICLFFCLKALNYTKFDPYRPFQRKVHKALMFTIIGLVLVGLETFVAYYAGAHF